MNNGWWEISIRSCYSLVKIAFAPICICKNNQRIGCHDANISRFRDVTNQLWWRHNDKLEKTVLWQQWRNERSMILFSGIVCSERKIAGKKWNNAVISVNNHFFCQSCFAICQWFLWVTESLANHLTHDQKIINHCSSCIILYITWMKINVCIFVKFSLISFWMSNLQEIMVSGDVLAPNRLQTITWTSDCHELWHHMALLGHIDLTSSSWANSLLFANIYFLVLIQTWLIVMLNSLWYNNTINLDQRHQHAAFCHKASSTNWASFNLWSHCLKLISTQLPFIFDWGIGVLEKMLTFVRQKTSWSWHLKVNSLVFPKQCRMLCYLPAPVTPTLATCH